VLAQCVLGRRSGPASSDNRALAGEASAWKWLKIENGGQNGDIVLFGEPERLLCAFDDPFGEHDEETT